MEESVYKYDAFISYRHLPKDMKTAKKLQNILEGDIVPARSGLKKRRLRICRDESEFTAGGDLSEQIRMKLRESKYLIFVCGVETKGSPYCMEEIKYFKKIHNGSLDKVLILLLEGDPDKVLPEELTYEMCEIHKPDGSRVFERHTIEPLFCDIRAESERESMRLLRNEFLRLAAPLLDCGYDDLFQRYLRRRMKMKVTMAAVCMAIVSIISVLVYAAWISKKSQAMVYEYTAKECIENGEWSQALMYYGKALELDSSRQSSQLGAALLLQQHVWPYMEAEEEYTGICGNCIYPIFYNNEKVDDWDHCCLSVTPSGDYMLWGNIRDEYLVTDGEGKLLYTLDGKGGAWSEDNASCWVFYNSEKKMFTFHWPEEQLERELYWMEESYGSLEHPSACVLSFGRVVINDNRNLYLYELNSIENKEIMCISLDSLFGNQSMDESGDEGKWKETDRQNMWSSLDGGILAVSEVVTYGVGRRVDVCSNTALFDTREMELLTIIENDQYVLDKVVFSDDGQHFSLLYNNSINNFMEPGGLVCVYTRDGEKVLATEAGYSFIPRDAAFYDNSFLVWDYTTVHFWDIVNAQEYAVPLTTPEGIQGVTKMADGRYAVEWLLDVHYYSLVCFGEEASSGMQFHESAEKEDITLEVPRLVTEELYVYLQNEKTVVLSDEEGNAYDIFSLKREKAEAIISIFYIPSVETLFLVDTKDELYCIPILLDKKQFMDVDGIDIAAFVGNVCAAKDGMLVWCYLTNLVRYYTRDAFDRIPRYLAWETEQENKGIFLGMCDDENYAVFIIQDEKNERFIAEVRDMKDGKYINEFTVDGNIPLDAMMFESNGVLIYLQGGKWSRLKVDIPSPDRKAVQKLISLSGHILDENQVVVSNAVPVDVDSFGNWTNIFR